MMGAKFRRQHEFGPYILDFFCPEHRVAVEADGSQHLEPKALEKDLQRTTYREPLGVRLLRFNNLEILHEAQAVAVRIQEALEEPPSPSPCPRGRGSP